MDMQTNFIETTMLEQSNYRGLESKAYKLVLYHYSLHINPSLEIRLTKIVTKALIIDIDEVWISTMLNQEAENKITERIKRSLH